MADVEYRGVDDAPLDGAQNGAQTRRISKLVNTAGALMSVALVVGIGVWGYRLLVRDVTGVPVVRAIDGPMRVQPDDPGGMQTAHQGLSVNRVQSDGLAGPVPEQLTLAPVGAGVGEDDAAGLRRPSPRGDTTSMAEAADAEVVVNGPAEIMAPALLEETVSLPTLPTTVDDGEGVAVALADPAAPQLSATDAAVAEAMAMAATIAADTAPLTAVEAVTATVPVAVIPTTVAGVSHSPRPLMRPSGLNTTPATAPVEVAAAQTVSAPVTDVDATTISAGTRLAQLGAYDSAEIAQKEWDRLYGRFTEYMEGKSRVIQKAESGGRTFYRLRAMGFDNLSDARRFCSALLAEKAACIPVKVR